MEIVNFNVTSCRSDISSNAYRLWNDYSNYVNFAGPFLFARIMTPFKNDEYLSSRIVEGTVFSGIAAVVEHCVLSGYLTDYSFSYLPVVGSFLYHQNILEANNLVSAAFSVSAVAFTKFAIDHNSLYNLIPPVVTYMTCKASHLPIYHALGLSVISGVADWYFTTNNNSSYNLNYASWSVAGGAIVHNIFNKFVPGVGDIIGVSVAVVAGSLLAKFEPQIIEQFFATEHFKDSYNAISNITSHEKLNLALERHYVMTSCLQIGLGFYGNFLLTNLQDKNNAFVAIGSMENEAERIIAYHKFMFSAAKYALRTAPIYTFTRMGVDSLNTYNNIKLTNDIKADLLDNYFLTQENFISSAKTNFTVQAYLKDIETISQDNEILRWSIFGIPKLSKIGGINLQAALGLVSVIVIDLGVSAGFQYITKMMQEFSEENDKYISKFDKINVHDREYAATILQKNALNYTKSHWSELQENKDYNYIMSTILSGMIASGQGFYNQDILYTALHMIVAYLSKNSFILPAELFLYTRALETASDLILFKTKNEASFKKTESAIDRINQLSAYLNDNDQDLQVAYQIDLNASSLIIENLDFTRGYQDKKTKLHIDKLELDLGRIYAFTGQNGAGKSSLATLLQYIVSGAKDLSFDLKSGSITYPADKIEMIPQKDYIAYGVSLFDIISHPEMDFLKAFEDKMVSYINKLAVFDNNDSFTAEKLYEIKEDWGNLSGGQKKKLFLIKSLVTCPKMVIMDEIFGPLDPKARTIVMDVIKDSCLRDSLILIVWHQDSNEDGTSCVKETFFDYEAHIANETISLGLVGADCLY